MEMYIPSNALIIVLTREGLLMLYSLCPIATYRDVLN